MEIFSKVSLDVFKRHMNEEFHRRNYRISNSTGAGEELELYSSAYVGALLREQKEIELFEGTTVSLEDLLYDYIIYTEFQSMYLPAHNTRDEDADKKIVLPIIEEFSQKKLDKIMNTVFRFLSTEVYNQLQLQEQLNLQERRQLPEIEERPGAEENHIHGGKDQLGERAKKIMAFFDNWHDQRINKQ